MRYLTFLLLLATPSCTLVGGCQPGSTRCRGQVLEECHDLTGWERAQVCDNACHYDDPLACGTYDIGCCR